MFRPIGMMSIAISLLSAADPPPPDITIRWETKTISCPSTASKPKLARARIRGINDMLYSYDVDVTTILPQFNDGGEFLSALPSRQQQPGESKALVDSDCQAKLSALAARHDKLKIAFEGSRYLNPQPDAAGKYPSVSAEDTKAAWALIHLEAGALKQSIDEYTKSCTLAGTAAEAIAKMNANLARIEELYKLVENRPHAIDLEVELLGGAEYKFKVVERYNGAITINGEYEFKCKVESSALVLSMGGLLSGVASQTYRVQQVPKVASAAPGQPPTTLSESYPALVVDGTKTNFSGTALLNYHLPFSRKTRPGLFDLYLSSGPTYKFGSTPDVSNFGFFAGLSLGVNRRLMLTPGFHVGQFADFPLGFSSGSFVPPNYSPLPPTPIKRWTARFGFSISYRVNSLGTAAPDTPKPAATPGSNNAGTPAVPVPKPSPAKPEAPKPEAVKPEPGPQPAASSATSLDRATQVTNAAVANPFTQEAFEAWLSSLAKFDGYYLVEGDLPMTADEARSYLSGKNSSPLSTFAAAGQSPELAINVYKGNADYYKEPGSRVLTYAIDRSSFAATELEAVQVAMRVATRDWEAACPECKVEFRHVESPVADTVNFVVRQANSGGQFLAMAFFPHTERSRRILYVDSTAFRSTLSTPGILRHELGHVLGYRHEHTRNVPGCYFEDNQWKPITKYDPKSVMHYFCGGGGNRELVLTELDKAGHRRQYGLSPSATATRLAPVEAIDLSQQTVRSENAPLFASLAAGPSHTGPLRIYFQGGDISENALRVVQILIRRKLVDYEIKKVPGGSSVGAVLVDKLDLPTVSSPAAAAELAKLLSLVRSVAPAVPARMTPVPDIDLDERRWYADFVTTTESGRNRLEQFQQANKAWIKSTNRRPNGVLGFELTGYEMVVRSQDYAALNSARNDILALKSPEIIPQLENPSWQAPRYSRGTRADVYFQDYRRKETLNAGPEGCLAKVLNWAEVPVCVSKPLNRPELVVIDHVAPHPDLPAVAGVTGAPAGPPFVDAEKKVQKVRLGQYRKERDHGTHIAGLVAAQLNDFGFVGVSPGVSLKSLNGPGVADWDYEVIKEIEERRSHNFRQGVYLFTSEYPSSDEGSPYEKWMRDRTTLLGRRIPELNVLWVVSAGQATDKRAKRDVGADTRYGPMNLGDKDNVLVVSACRNCYEPSAALYDWADFSTSGFVHVAAPGDALPSTLGDPDGSYDLAEGTSQAAALVAGVASAMISCWDAYYASRPDLLKRRMIVTSRPLRQSGTMAGGVVEPVLATLDPKYHYYAPNGVQTAPDVSKYQRVGAELAPIGWCKGKLPAFRDAFGGPLPLGDEPSPKQLLRLFRLDDKLWTAVKAQGGQIIQQGPLRMIGDPAIKFNGTIVDLSGLGDLLLSTEVSTEVDCTL